MPRLRRGAPSAGGGWGPCRSPHIDRLGLRCSSWRWSRARRSRRAPPLAFVATLAAFADRLGRSLSGALAPFPVALGVLPMFAHAQQGAAPAIGLLRGFFPAMWGFALFCLVIALAMVPLGPALAFLLAVAAQGAVHGIVLWRVLRVRSGQWPARIYTAFCALYAAPCWPHPCSSSTHGPQRIFRLPARRLRAARG